MSANARRSDCCNLALANRRGEQCLEVDQPHMRPRPVSPWAPRKAYRSRLAWKCPLQPGIASEIVSKSALLPRGHKISAQRPPFQDYLILNTASIRRDSSVISAHLHVADYNSSSRNLYANRKSAFLRFILFDVSENSDDVHVQACCGTVEPGLDHVHGVGGN